MFLFFSVTMLVVNTDALQRLGILVTSRRVELGERVRKRFAESVDLSDRLLADIENGVRPAGAGTYAVLEQELRWRPGSIKDILRGGNPTVVNEQETQPVDLRRVSNDALITELRRRLPDDGGKGKGLRVNPDAPMI
jgi:hypothetical protein